MIRLRQTQGADAGRELEFDQELIRIGRMPDSDLNFDPEVDLDASGRHAEIRNEDGRYLLIDTGSRNGTWLNGQRIKHVALGDGDEIEFGRGGPRVVVAAVRNRRIREPTGKISTAPGRRDPKFDPLAMPVTTATRLEDLVTSSDAGRIAVLSSRQAGVPRRRRGRNRALFWAAGLLLVSAIALIANTALR